MTPQETLFYLREVRSHWSTSNVSPEKLAELEAAKLIERSAEPVTTIRLTHEGARLKAAGRPPNTGSGLNLIKKHTSRHTAPRSARGKRLPRAKRLE